MKHNWFKRTSTVMIMQFLGAALAYGSFTALARNMSASNYGQLQYVLSWSFLLGLLGSLGVPHWAHKAIPEFRSQSQWGKLKGFLKFSYYSMFMASLVVALLFFMIFYWHEQNPSVWFFGALLIPLTAVLNLQAVYGRITGQIVIAHFPINIIRYALLAGSVLLIPALSYPLTPTNILMFVVGGLSLTLLIQGFLILPKLWPKSSDPATVEPLPWLRVSLVFMGIGAGAFAMEQADILVLGLLKSKSEVAYYFAANRTASLIGLIYFSFYGALVPVLSKLYHDKEMNRLEKLLTNSSRGMVLVSFCALLIVLGFHKQILGLFGPDYINALPELTLLCLSQMTMAFIGLSEGFLSMTNQPKISLKIYVFSVGVDVALNFLFIPFWGTVGAAGATLVAKIFLTTLMIRAAKRSVKEKLTKPLCQHP